MTFGDLVTAAIISAARKSSADRRLVLRAYLGMDLDDVHGAMLKAADETIDLVEGFEVVLGRRKSELGDPADYVLNCITTGSGPTDPILIPYRVSAQPQKARNMGSQGFGAALRSAASAAKKADDMRPRILIFLDPQPVETILTASEDASALPELLWKVLCERAVDELPESEIKYLLKAIANEMGDGHPSAGALEKLIRFANETWQSSSDLGAALHQLDRYLSDPSLDQHDLAERLKAGVTWRRNLESWSAPDSDLDRRLAEKRISEDVAARMSATLTPDGLDYSQFTLDDLESAPNERGLRWTTPLRVTDGASITTAYQGRDVIIAWLPGGGKLSVLLTGDADGTEEAAVHVPGAASAQANVLPAQRRLQVELVGGEGKDWVSGTVELRSTAGRQTVGIMAFFGLGSWFPIERKLAADVDICAFLVEGEPDVIAAGAAGQFLDSANLSPPQGGVEPEYIDATARGETWPIPILVVSTEDSGEGDEDDALGGEFDDEPFEDEDPNADGSAGGRQGGRETSRGNRPPQRSPMHAALHAAAALNSSDVGDIDYNTQGFLKVGGANYELYEADINGLPMTDIEAMLLTSPRTTSFILTSDRELVPGDLAIESLERMTPEVERFLAAREALFATLASRGSIFALGAGIDIGEANEYLDAYAALVSAPERGQRYTPGYDALIMCDSIHLADSGDVLIAPTNPLSMAFYTRFASAAVDWISEQALPSSHDIGNIGARHLLPMFNHGDRWYESMSDQPFAWRRYQPKFNASAPVDHDPRLIAERIRFFLSVYPTYNDPRQRLSLLFRDPSMATVIEALKRFYALEIRRANKLADGRAFERPALDVALVTESADIERDVRRLLESPGDSVVDRILRERVSFRVIHASEADGIFSHIAFLFGSNMESDTWPVALSERAPTSFVGGLATGSGRVRLSSTGETTFAWGTFAPTLCGDSGGSQSGTAFESMLRSSLELVGAQPRELIQPGHTRMPIATVDESAIAKIYDDSVWVVHLDHLLGLEAFQPSPTQTLYIIDYKEGNDPESTGLDAITVTGKVDPYHHALKVALSDLAQLTDKGRDSILSLLNSVSGRWALQLLRQAPHQIRERIGTVTAVAALRDLDSCFRESEDNFGILLPLDEIWTSVERRAAQEPRHPSCDDLVYFQITVPDEAGFVAVYARLIEVKYRSASLPDLAEAREELESARVRLEGLFGATGPSRLFRGRDLSELLRTGRARNRAFRLNLGPDRKEFEKSLASIAAGDFRFYMDYHVGSDRVGGDVISVEAGSASPAIRLELPGLGTSFGLVRLGQEALATIARGEQLERPAGWQTPEFGNEPPQTVVSDAPMPPEPPPSDDADASTNIVDSEQQTASSSSAAGVGVDSGTGELEVRRYAAELDRAAVKYGLSLEPFQPHLAQVGPSVIHFRTRPLGRQTLAGVQRLALDLGREVGAGDGVIVEQEAYFITVDVPRAKRETIRYADYAPLLDREGEVGCLEFLVGMAPSGEVEIADLARLPHLLVAGATGSGKSVFLRGLLAALVRRKTPDQLKVLLVDPKQVDFMPFEGLPHLMLGGAITDPAEAVVALAETIESERSHRLPILKEAGATNVIEYYESGGDVASMPQIVVLVDEFADLATSLDRDERTRFMSLIQSYGQITRAFGIYLVLATQRPSVQVITGDIKANLTARVALKMQSSQDSITILGRGGAERLRDRGDLIFEHGGASSRLQGFYTTGDDARAAVARWTG